MQFLPGFDIVASGKCNDEVLMLKPRHYVGCISVFALAFCFFMTLFALCGCEVGADGSGSEGEPDEYEAAITKLCEAMEISREEAVGIMELLAETGFPGDVRFVREWTSQDRTAKYYRVRSSDGTKRDVYLDGDIAVAKITDGDSVLYEAGTFAVTDAPNGPDESAPDGSASYEAESTDAPAGDTSGKIRIILNTSTKKYHYPGCRFVAQMSEENMKTVYVGDISELLEMGYAPCGVCAKADAETENR